jgi:hypothetical protein
VEARIVERTGWTFPELDAAPGDRLALTILAWGAMDEQRGSSDPRES